MKGLGYLKKAIFRSVYVILIAFKAFLCQERRLILQAGWKLKMAKIKIFRREFILVAFAYKVSKDKLCSCRLSLNGNVKERNKLSWYLNRESNYEDLFFNYSKDNGKVKAAWGYMIQQGDWDGAENYFTKIAPDAKATGQPYYMLKYYYNTIGKGSEHEDLYDAPTDKYVGKFCPPVH